MEPKSFGDVITGLGGGAAVGRMLGVGQSTVSEMKRRDSIPAEYWQALVAAAEARGIEGITYERLAGIAAAKRAPAPADGAAA